MLFSHCFLECFLSSGAIFLKVRSDPLLELFTQPYVAHEGIVAYIYMAMLYICYIYVIYMAYICYIYGLYT